MRVTELPQEKYLTVRNLFGTDYPNLPFVCSVIENRIPGKVLVDDVSHLNACLVTTTGPFCFIAGQLSNEIFVKFLPFLKEKPSTKLVCPVSSVNGLLELADFGFEAIPRLQYQYKSTAQIPYYENNSEYELMSPQEKTISACNRFSLMNSFYGSAENYLKQGSCLILYDVKKKRVASEAHGIVAKDIVEIGTMTHEDYRCQRLSTIVCNKLIHDCISKGLHPIWTCDKTNLASRKVAEHQGMDIKMEYTFYTLKH